MEKLEEFDHLINAMGALFYVSKRMATQIPCCLEAWKNFAFEQKASKIHELLSTGNASITSPMSLSNNRALSPANIPTNKHVNVNKYD